jgi:hypothetical protein
MPNRSPRWCRNDRTKLLAGLHQAEHAVASLSAIATDRPTRDLPLDDKPAKIPFRCVRIQWRFRPLENSEQLVLSRDTWGHFTNNRHAQKLSNVASFDFEFERVGS